MKRTWDLYGSMVANAASPFCHGNVAQDYGHLLERIDILRGSLRERLTKPTVIACAGLPASDFAALLVASWYEGHTVFPLNAKLPPATLSKHLSDCDAVLATSKSTAFGSDHKRLYIEDLLAGSAVPLAAPPLKLKSPATIVLTSGSGGNPKYVLHSIGNHYFSALGINQTLDFGTPSRWLLCLPMHHVSGLAILTRAMVAGASVIPVKDSASLEEAVIDHQPTHISLVATQLQRLLSAGNVTGQLKQSRILLGGSAIAQNLLHAARELGLNMLYPGYGLTEMASTVAIANPDNPQAATILPYRKAKVLKDGEVALAGETRFLGYLENGALEKPFDRSGWFLSGDLGEMDRNGKLKISGRKDNMFISGGENIQPEEIERILLKHPAVDRAIVVAVSDKEFGRRPAAFVKGKSIKFEEIRSYLKKHLAGFKVPDYFFELPEESAGSIKAGRAELAKKAEQLKIKKASVS